MGLEETERGVADPNLEMNAPDGGGSSAGGGGIHPVREAAHELSNVIGVIRMTTELLDQDAINSAEATETIREQLREASEVVKKLRQELGV